MNVYIIRHGETNWNKAGKIQGHSDIPLNENGIRVAMQTAEAAEGMHFDRIYSSPLIRAFTTAMIISKAPEESIIKDARIAEMCFGKGEGQNIKWIRKFPFLPMHNFFERPEKYMPPKGGETFEQLRSRSKDFFYNEIAPLENQMDSVAIFSHGAFIHETVSWVENLDRKDYWSGPRLGNCSFTILDLKDGKFTLIEEGKTII